MADRDEKGKVTSCFVICKTSNQVGVKGLSCQRVGRRAHNQREEGRGREIMGTQLCSAKVGSIRAERYSSKVGNLNGEGEGAGRKVFFFFGQRCARCNNSGSHGVMLK